MKAVIETMAQYMKTKQQYDEARAQCKYDWGYFGSGYELNLERAEEALSTAMDEYIDKRIETKLKEMLNGRISTH